MRDTIRTVNVADVQSFLARDWALIHRSKTDQWTAQKAAMTPSEAIEFAAELYRYVRAVRPDWPNSAERDADFAAHQRVAEIFQHACQDRPR